MPGLKYPEDWEMPYEERPKVDLTVEDDETLGSVLGRAAVEFGVALPDEVEGVSIAGLIGSVAFYRPEHKREFGRLRSEVVLLDEGGRARWVALWPEVSYGQVLRAGVAGVLDGDPQRPYLILQPGVGNGALPDLSLLAEGLKVSWEVLKEVGTAYGIWKAFEELANRVRRASDVVEAHADHWTRNNLRPDNLVAFLGQKNWSAGDLARALGCAEGDAEVLLLAFGFARSPSGVWRPAEDEEGKLLRGNADILMHLSVDFPNDTYRLIRERAEHLAETGDAPELDWDEVQAKVLPTVRPGVLARLLSRLLRRP